MAFNGSGTFVRTDGVRSGSNLHQQQQSAATGIDAVLMDTEKQDMADGLSNCITKDGQTTVTANIPMNSNKITGLANGTASTDAINLGQVQGGAFALVVFAGTNTYTGSASPNLTGYTNGQWFIATFANVNTTTTPTANIDSQGAKTIVKNNDVALRNGDLQPNAPYLMKYDSGLDKMVITSVPAHVDNTSITTNTSTGALEINAGGVDTAELASNAVTPGKTEFVETNNVSNIYFAKTNGTTTLTENPGSWTLAHTTDPGVYTVTHNFGSSSYGVIAQTHAAETFVTTSALGNNTFELTVTTEAGAQANSVIDMIVWRY